MIRYKIRPAGLPNPGELFVNHEENHRSGHLSHALVEFAPGKVMAFYSNCSGNRNKWAPGHNGFGWLEYRVSEDYGETWGETNVLDYSMQSFLNEPFTVSCEKAVSPSENVIVAFCIRNENPNGWEPYLSPVAVRSFDAGETWEDPISLCEEKGRIYDAFVYDGEIYVLLLANDDFLTSKQEHRYLIFKSSDAGETYERISELPGQYLHHAYGTMATAPNGDFLCYIYNADDEYNLDLYVSHDKGISWQEPIKSYCAKRIRNPQIARVHGGYILHGRSGCVDRNLPMDLVLYQSNDGIHWDDGTVVCSTPGMTAYYSNNLVMDLPDGSQKVLIQSSVPYDKGRVNISHWLLDIQ